MPVLKGFSTKKDVLAQFKDAGVEIKLGFSTNSGLKVAQNPLEGFDVKESNGEVADIIIDPTLSN